MIKGIIKKRQEQGREHFQKAMRFFENSAYQQASLEFKNAFKKDKALILVLRKKIIIRYDREAYQEALVLGRYVLNVRKDDFELANMLGNCDRKIGNIQQSMQYYKYALNKNKSYKIALYNMAAAMGEVDLYDENIKKAIDAYCNFKSFLVPDLDYQNNPKVLDYLTTAVKQKKYFSEIENLQEGIFENELKHDDKMVEEIQKAAISMKQKFKKEISFHTHDQSTRQILKDAIKQNWNTLSLNETHEIFWDIFNLGMEVISQKKVLEKKEVYFPVDLNAKVDLQLAKDCFEQLKKESCRFKYLDMTESLIGFIEKDTDKSLNLMLTLLEGEKDNRYYNINLGLMYKMLGKSLLAYKYLARGAKRLIELEGNYKLSDIISLADRRVQKGDFDEALKLYQLASLETENIRVLEKLGDVLLDLEKFDDAVTVFNEILRIDPNDQTARQSIKKASGKLLKSADQLFSVKQYSKALRFYQTVLNVEISIEVLGKAVDTAKRNGKKELASELEKKHLGLLQQQKVEEMKKSAQKYLTLGKKYLSEKKYLEAIENFNEAFRLHADKSTYSILVFLYQKLNYKTALNALKLKWENIVKQGLP